MSETTSTQTFKCPNCGAPIGYDGKGETAVRCPYCGTSAAVPEELLPLAVRKINVMAVPAQSVTIELPASPGTSRSSGLGCVIGFVILFVAVGGAILAIVLGAVNSSVPTFPTMPAI